MPVIPKSALAIIILPGEADIHAADLVKLDATVKRRVIRPPHHSPAGVGHRSGPAQMVVVAGVELSAAGNAEQLAAEPDVVGQLVFLDVLFHQPAGWVQPIVWGFQLVIMLSRP